MPHTHYPGFPSWDVALALALISTATVYVRGWRQIREPDRDSAASWRAVSFLVGLLLIWLAMASPIATFDHRMLTGHMIQHLVLMTLAPPLIWLGNPIEAILHGLPQRLVEVISHFFRSTPIGGFGYAIAQPSICWLAAAGTLIGWHIPSLFALGLRSEIWHGVEQASFLFSGLLFWWPVVRPWPSTASSSEWTILLYLFLATLPCDILSGFLVFCDRVVYPVYFSSYRVPGFSALEDQQCAGALMWTCVTVVYLVAGTIYAARLLSPGRLRQPRISRSDPHRGALLQESPCTGEIV